MEALQGIGGASFLLISIALALRLLHLAGRTRAVPELLLGLAFLCGGIGAVLEAGGQVLAPERAGPVMAAGKAIGGAGLALNAVFVWWVFRRGERWALWLMSFLVLLQGLGYAVHGLTGTFEAGLMARGAFWLEFLGRVASPLWLGGEAWGYWLRMRRRARIGLSDALLQNRFLLWTLASLTGVLLLATSAVPLYVQPGTPLSDLNLAAFGLLGLTTASFYWLAFFPPRAYRRWVIAAPG